MTKPWLPILRRLLDGNYVSDTELAAALRAGGELPQNVREYLAARLEGTLPAHLRPTAKRPRGSQWTDKQRSHRNHTLQVIAARVDQLQAEYKARGLGKTSDGRAGPYERALETVAQELGALEDLLGQVRPRKKSDPDALPTDAESLGRALRRLKARTRRSGQK